MKTLEEVFETWEAVIGLEIHAELTTLETKMFCGCKLEFGAAPNTHTCPVCTGMPGTLPVLNRQVLEYAVAVFGAGFEPRDRYAVQASYGAASVYRLVVLGTFDVVEVSAVVGGYLDPRYGVDIGLPYDGKFVLSAGLYVRPLRYDGLFLLAEHGRQRDRQDQQ